jgi:chondroitin AC lyase
MYKYCLCFLLIIISFNTLFAADTTSRKPIDARLKVLKQNVINDVLSASFNEEEVISLAHKLKEDGSWGDIDYTDKTRGGWPVNDHLVRLENMAILYARPGSKWRNDKKLEDKIISGLKFWFKNDFICPNWWYPQIGVPRVLGPTMLLMEDKLTSEQIQAGLKILDRAKIGMTGQNKVWLSGNVIVRSLLTNNVELIKAAVASIQEEVIISEGEGIQPDYSFHQHGPQQQFGNYGSAYAGDILKWAIIFQNTPFQFSPLKIEILRNYMLHGMRWVVWKNKMDISACGRQLFPGAQAGKARSIKQIFSQMPLVDNAFKQQYLTAMNDFSGDKFFWRSDMTVHRRNNFYTSVKMSSKRVAGAESCNDENIQGYHLGDGATYFYQSGNEYTDIFPFWDWKMIPGTTTFHDAAPLPVLPCSGYRIESDFVGGASDGTNGIATLAYNRDNLKAQKSWFFFDDAIVCLGAGINSNENKEVRTTVNQSFLHGDVLLKQSTSPQKIEAGKHESNATSWILHDNWGYYFPGKANIEMTNREQGGDWNKVLKRMPSKEIKANLFTVWINHSNQPKAAHYAYYVFPAATVNNIEARGLAIEIVENSDKLQVVEVANKQMAGFVFVQPGEAKTRLFNKVSANKPCAIMITKKGSSYNVVVSDPTHKEESIVIRLDGKKNSKTSTSIYDASKNETAFTINLPKGPEAGKSVELIID